MLLHSGRTSESPIGEDGNLGTTSCEPRESSSAKTGRVEDRPCFSRAAFGTPPSRFAMVRAKARTLTSRPRESPRSDKRKTCRAKAMPRSSRTRSDRGFPPCFPSRPPPLAPRRTDPSGHVAPASSPPLPLPESERLSGLSKSRPPKQNTTRRKSSSPNRSSSSRRTDPTSDAVQSRRRGLFPVGLGLPSPVGCQSSISPASSRDTSSGVSADQPMTT